ncbi:hypothetical protein J3F83DRAFT_754734 [Trichoderma novae-zelandiae]
MSIDSDREYTVGWICALPIELVAAESMLDQRYTNNSNGQYTLGRIGFHNVVIACLPAGLMGTSAAAAVAAKMLSNFPSIQFGLMVGIGGGVPSREFDIRLGDVVVSQPRNGYGGVVQHDFGKTRPGEFEMTGFLNTPPIVLLDTLSRLQAEHLAGNSKFDEYLQVASRWMPSAFVVPKTDVLFESDYEHMEGSTCENCSEERRVKREPRERSVAVHYGTIASGNQVMRDGSTRDRLSAQFGGVLCFEMEAAGLMNSFPCLVIRGICDYADSHKNKAWQSYAAATAAAYAKDALTVIPRPEGAQTGVADGVNEAELTRNEIEATIDAVNPDWFLSILPAIHHEEFHSSYTPSFDREPEHSLVFRNTDFKEWTMTRSSRILWLSGPPECSIHKVASFILHQELDKSLSRQRRVLYFFCSSATAKVSSTAVFIRSLACQVISTSPKAQQASIMRTFLRGILIGLIKKIPKGKMTEHFSRRSSQYINKLLGAPEGCLWAALWAVLHTERNIELSILIAGIEWVQDQRTDFIRGIRRFVDDLKRTFKVKILLSSGLDIDTASIFDGLPHIEYDRERKECLSSLSFANTRFGKITRASGGTFEWLWEHAQYRQWSKPDVSSVLLIEGKPGSGKSTLTKYFNEHILQQQPAASSAVVARFFYSDREGSLQRSHSNMLRSLLYDLLCQDQAFFYHIQPEYRLQSRYRSNGPVDWRYDSLKQIFKALLDYPLPRPLYLIIDAVDESDEEDRRDIIKLLFELSANTRSGTVKIFVASRPVVQLEVRRKYIDNIIQLQAETVPDISLFAHSMLDGLNMSLLLDKATEYIINNANGVFLWVRLVGCELEASIEDSESEDAIFQRLKQLPTELNDFYHLMLRGLDNKPHTADSITMFLSVLWAGRPVTVDELLQAVAISNIPDIEPLSDESFEKRIPLRGRMTRCGGNFLEFKQSNGRREIVQVMHQTVREFFLAPNGCATRSEFLMSERDAIIYVARMCIRCLILCARCTALTRTPPATRLWTAQDFDEYSSYLAKRPFANYALSFLEQHFSSCYQDIGVEALVAQLSRGLASTPFRYFIEEWIHSNAIIDPRTERERLSAMEFRSKLLHAAASNGQSVAVEVLLGVGTDINSRSETGSTALSRAAQQGHKEVARCS